jgi:hypothetical protein
VGIGASIFLIAAGAIVAFALDVQVGWLDLAVAGWVLMLAGVAGLVLTLTMWNGRRRTTVVTPEPPVRRHVITPDPDATRETDPPPPPV